MTKGYFEFEYLKRRDLNDEVQKVVQNYFNIYNSLAGTVDYFANLPSASANLNKVWLVRFATTFLGIITKQAGLYISDGTNWNWMTSLEAKADKNRLISAGNGLTGGGDLSVDRIISHSDTSSQVNVVNTNGNVIQSANLDDFGHITSFSSIDLDNRYITTSGAYANPTWITSLDANKLTGTIPSNVLGASTVYIGTTAIALNRASGNQALTGISSVQFTGATSGTATIQAPAVAGTTTFTLPTTSGNLIGSNDVIVNNWNTSYNRSPTALSVTGTTTKTITLTKQDGTTLTANWSDLNTDAVTSVFGRTGVVVATEGDYSLNLLSDVTITTPTTNQLLQYNGTNWVNWTSNYLTLTSLSVTSPLNYNNTTGVFTINQSNTTTNGFLSSVDWNTFNNKQSAISLTTTGNSGASSFVSNVLNIPNYTLAGLGGQPLLSGTGFVKANGTTITYDNSTYLTANQTITLSGDITGSGTTAITTALANSGVVAGTYQSATTITPLTIDAKGRITSAGAATTIAPAFSSITGKPTTIAGYGITDGVTLTGTETLTNKTFTDNTTFFQDNLDNSKKAQFELSNIATATTRTYTLPNVNGTIITTGDTATVTNTMLAGSIADSKLNTITTAGKVANSATTATNLNTVNAIVSRDNNGNFETNKITLNSGTFSAPSLVIGTNTNTGLYSSAANSLDFTVNSIRRVAIDTQGFKSFGSGNINTNSAIGGNALIANTTGFQNTAIGAEALKSNTTGFNNTGLGAYSLLTNTTGTNNTAVGITALQKQTTADGNTAVGLACLQETTTGFYNTSIGGYGLFSNTTGASNTAIGYASSYRNTTGIYNTAIGIDSLYNNITTSYNTAIGAGALTNNTGSGNSALGSQYTSFGVYDPAFNITTQNNLLSLGHKLITTAYINVSWTIVSDARDKTNFAKVPYGIDFVKKLKPVSYERKIKREEEKGDGKVRYGFLAQDILELEGDKPVLVENKDKEHLYLNENCLIPILVNAIQELQQQIEELKNA